MRWFFLGFFLVPTILSSKQLSLTIPATYPLNVINTQLICSSLHAHLSSDALSKLETLSQAPFTCIKNSNENELIITFALKE